MTEKIPYARSEFLGDSEISKVPVESMLTSLWGISHGIHSTYAAISKNQAQKICNIDVGDGSWRRNMLVTILRY